MAKAYKCDKCQRYFDGYADMQLQFGKGLEKIILGIKYSPENGDNSPLYFHDLCPNCAKDFCAWWSKKGDK